VVDVAVLALAAARQAADDLLVVGLDEQDGGEAAAQLVEGLLQRLGLATVRGKPSRRKPS